VLNLAVAFELGLWEKVSKVFHWGGILRVGLQRDGATGRFHGRVLGNLLITDKILFALRSEWGMRRRRSDWIECVLKSQLRQRP
jgi:hypothetical protein